MNINLTDEAIEWFKEEVNVQKGEYIKFFVRYGGCGTVQTGFSLGISKELPQNDYIATTINGVYYYINKEDEWYFNEHDLHVRVNPLTKEIEFHYVKATA